ncbi:helix-turn-helix domain-containing protein [Flammeovirga aprica]|uniref:Helix-turn-helix transcriptional regulator n=1 Tax=Flammeovirga aprica JL-4 TaxID=694437 RepID=A0A7X9RTW8_9BACT|nr:AraC family transcriptional regulator [Flammeovirga aprica]NME67952.1 helix-turn-helix transcriptional regulator [Flammeovirga aprica JL-4]
MEKIEISELSYSKNLEELTKVSVVNNDNKLKKVRKWNTTDASGVVETFSFSNYQLQFIKLKTYQSLDFILDAHHYYMIFSLKDNALSILNHKSLTVEEGIILKQRKLECHLSKGHNTELLIFSFDATFFQSSFVDSSNLFKEIFPKTVSSTFELNKKIQNILWNIIENDKKGDSEYLYINAKIYELLTEVYEVRFPVEEVQDEREEKLHKVKNIITNDLEFQYSIPDLSKQIGMNASYLKKNFKAIFNETIFEFANRKRMQKAQVLLVSTTLPIAIISEKIGYQHASHFSYAFKNSIGITPNKYRAQHKQSEA